MRQYLINNMKHYLGIDLGLSGALALINEKKRLIECVPIPVMDCWVGKKLRPEYNIEEIVTIIKKWLSEYHIALVGVERLRAIPHQSSQTAFSMGGSAMLFRTIFNIFGVEYIEIEPVIWQKSVFKDDFYITRKEEAENATKKASIKTAERLFPGFNFKRTKRSRIIDHNMTDSANIAYYISNL